MARFRVPGERKVGRPPKKHKLSHQMKSKFAVQKKKESNLKKIKPQVITMRRFREIFGYSDDEVIHILRAVFVAFCSSACLLFIAHTVFFIIPLGRRILWV